MMFSVAARVCVCRDQRCGDPVKVWCSSHHILHPDTSCSYIQLQLKLRSAGSKLLLKLQYNHIISTKSWVHAAA